MPLEGVDEHELTKEFGVTMANSGVAFGLLEGIYFEVYHIPAALQQIEEGYTALLNSSLQRVA